MIAMMIMSILKRSDSVVRDQALSMTNNGWVPETLQTLHPILKMLRDPDLSAGWKCLAVAVACILAPLVEEVFYRGFLQTALRRCFRGRWPAILVASAQLSTDINWPIQ